MNSLKAESIVDDSVAVPIEAASHWQSVDAAALESFAGAMPHPMKLGWLAGYLARASRTVLPLFTADWLAFAATAAIISRWVSQGSATSVTFLPHPLLLLAAAQLLLFVGFRLYPGVGLTFRSELVRTAGAVAILAAALAGVGMASGQYSGAITLAATVGLLGWPLILAARYAVRRVCRGLGWWGQPVLIFGDGEPARVVYDRIAEHPESGLAPVGWLGDWHSQWHGKPSPDDTSQLLGPLEAVVDVLQEQPVDRAILVLPLNRPSEQTRLRASLLQLFPHVSVVYSSEMLPSKGLARRRLDHLLRRTAHNRLLSPGPNLLKRAIDLGFVTVVGVLAIPFVLAIAPLIYLCSPGPIFFAQIRVGRSGRRFRLWKFRTMLPDAEQRLEEYLEQHPGLRSQWEAGHKMDDDPRVIPWIGSWMRRTGLDELPQLWNVLKGEMTLVGPRPLPEYHLEQFDEWFCRYRQQVTPGITGLWQVESRHDSRAEQFIRWDTEYIRNWSLRRDLVILFKTVAVVARGRVTS